VGSYMQWLSSLPFDRSIWLGMKIFPRYCPVLTLNNTSCFEFPAAKNAWNFGIVFYTLLCYNTQLGSLKRLSVLTSIYLLNIRKATSCFPTFFNYKLAIIPSPSTCQRCYLAFYTHFCKSSLLGSAHNPVFIYTKLSQIAG